MLHPKVAEPWGTLESPVPPADCHPKIAEGYAYWLRIHPPHGLPGRQHFDPTHIPGLLRHIRMLDVEGQPPRFKVRVVGTQFTERLGQDTTGQYLDQLFEGFEGSRFHRGLLDVIEYKRPIWRRGPLQWSYPKPYSSAERIHLPLARDGETIDMVLTITVYLT
jgi:hypothetical protein